MWITYREFSCGLNDKPLPKGWRLNIPLFGKGNSDEFWENKSENCNQAVSGICPKCGEFHENYKIYKVQIERIYGPGCSYCVCSGEPIEIKNKKEKTRLQNIN